MKKLLRVFSHIEPFLIYTSCVYFIGRVYQWIFNCESLWQSAWNKFMDIFGENEAFYFIVLSNLHFSIIYWGIGSILFLIEKYKYPLEIEKFKIQTKQNALIENGKGFRHVSD